MSRSHQPFLYQPLDLHDSRFPIPAFDPKAITRASREPKPVKHKSSGPLIKFNQHPDSHGIIPGRTSTGPSMGPRTKQWIRWTRHVQLSLRVLELNGAIGLLVVFILLTGMNDLTTWLMRITPGVLAVFAAYAIYHLSRPAAGRAPASSAAYQAFAAASDLVAVAIYVFGIVAVRTRGSGWSIRLKNRTILGPLLSTVFYVLAVAAGLHLLSLAMSAWLAWAFRQITLMPPDMNPLEDHLTSRPRHKKNKSSAATSLSTLGSEYDYEAPAYSQEAHLPRPSISFSETRAPPVFDVYRRSLATDPDISPRFQGRLSEATLTESLMQSIEDSLGESRRGRAENLYLPPRSVRELSSLLPRPPSPPDSPSDLELEGNRENVAASAPPGHTNLDFSPSCAQALAPHSAGLHAQETPNEQMHKAPGKTRKPRTLGDAWPKIGGPPARKSSIQADSDFCSKTYGELKPARIVVGANRQVSSGNDLGRSGDTYTRRVSGRGEWND